MNIRDNLLVTMGARAAYMHDKGCVELPSGVEGEQELAKFVVQIVDEYMRNFVYGRNFDEFIEKAIVKEYGRAKTTEAERDEMEAGYKSVTIIDNALSAMIKTQTAGETRNLNYTILQYLQYIEKQIMLLDERTR